MSAQHQRLLIHNNPHPHVSHPQITSTFSGHGSVLIRRPIDVIPGSLQLAKAGQRHVVVTPRIQTSGEIGALMVMVHPILAMGILWVYDVGIWNYIK